MLRLGLIVEGHGEVLALPALVFRILQERFFRHDVLIPAEPFRVPRSKFAGRFDDFEKAVRFNAISSDAILVVLDSDDDDPDSLREGLELRAQACTDVPSFVVPAVREYEAWFLAAITSLRGVRAVPMDASYDGDPETPRNAKGEFEKLLTTRTYSETADQRPYSSKIDLEAAEARSTSFRSLVTAIGMLP